MQILAKNVCEAWMRLIQAVLYQGKECSPRGMKIKELLHTQVVVEDARNNILTHPGRDINFRFMIAEWLWITTGRDDVAWIEKFNKNIVKFSDDGVSFRGAYGPRLQLQIDRVLELLKKDPDSRQAVISIFDGGFDLESPTKDVPCTIALQLLVRDGKVHGIMTMRSNDLWLGFPYDFFNFSQITNSIAGELDLQVGSFTLQAGSSHLYEPQWEQAKDVLHNQYSFVHFERSPQLMRIPPGMICDAVNDGGSTFSFESDEVEYIRALQSPTKAKALEILGTL